MKPEMSVSEEHQDLGEPLWVPKQVKNLDMHQAWWKTGMAM